MKNRMFTPLNRQRLLWAAVCGLLAVVAVLLFVAWRGSLAVPPEDSLLVRRTVLDALAWPVPAVLALELALAFGFGASVGLAVPPMEGPGTAVAARTAAHLLCSSALFAGVCWICGLPPANWQELLLLLGIYWLMYLVVWLLRYLRWRAELDAIRRALGLARPAAGGVWQARPLKPYLLLAGALELLLPLLLRLLDPPDVPVLTQLFYPYLLLPFFCLAVGWSAGRRFGVALLLPVACGVLTLLCVFLVYNYTALFQAGAAFVFTLAGNLLGALVRRVRRHSCGET
mgnify:CR=1 FL=1